MKHWCFVAIAVAGAALLVPAAHGQCDATASGIAIDFLLVPCGDRY